MKQNAFFVAYLLLLAPGVLLVAVYLFEDAKQLFNRQNLRDGKTCSFFSFIAILTVVTLNGSSTTIALATYTFTMKGKPPKMRTIMYGNLISWMIGFVVSSVYLASNVFGSYRGLYCCVKRESYDGLMVAQVFLVFGISAAAQIFFYTSSFWEARKHSQGGLNASNTAVAIMKRGLEMILVFYVSYVLIAIDAAAVFAGMETNIWISIIAAWMPKLEPFWHCFLLHRILKRMAKTLSQAHIRPLNTQDQMVGPHTGIPTGPKLFSSFKRASSKIISKKYIVVAKKNFQRSESRQQLDIRSLE